MYIVISELLRIKCIKQYLVLLFLMKKAFNKKKVIFTCEPEN